MAGSPLANTATIAKLMIVFQGRGGDVVRFSVRHNRRAPEKQEKVVLAWFL
jgi:hypothetical protein